MHNACWARKSASGHTCAWSAAGWRRRAQKPVAARRSHTGAPRRAQALRVRVRCTRGVSHDRPVVSGWPDAATRGFPVLAVMPRVASRITGARLGCAVPLTGSARKRHDQRWARHERDALPARTRRPGAAPACLGGRKTAGSVEMVSDLCFCVCCEKSFSTIKHSTKRCGIQKSWRGNCVFQ